MQFSFDLKKRVNNHSNQSNKSYILYHGTERVCAIRNDVSNILAVNFSAKSPLLKYRVDKISRDSKFRGIEFVAMRKVVRNPKF